MLYKRISCKDVRQLDIQVIETPIHAYYVSIAVFIACWNKYCFTINAVNYFIIELQLRIRGYDLYRY